jgi:hypothetical protein
MMKERDGIEKDKKGEMVGLGNRNICRARMTQQYANTNPSSTRKHASEKSSKFRARYLYCSNLQIYKQYLKNVHEF